MPEINISTCICNKRGSLVTLRLNSGRTLIVPPNSTSEKLLNQELNNNPKVKKLLDSGIIELKPPLKKTQTEKPRENKSSTKKRKGKPRSARK